MIKEYYASEAERNFMGLLNKVFLKKSINKENVDSGEKELVQKECGNEQVDYSNNFSSEPDDILPLWRSVPSDENRRKDMLNISDYSEVKIFFENGHIINVVPDVNNYYLATIYNIDGKDYDITSITSIMDIPLPTEKDKSFCGGTPVYNLEYLLRIHAGFAKDEGNDELAYALIHKGTEMMRFSNVDWKRHDYLREYFWLLDDDRIEEAMVFLQGISPFLPEPYSTKEYIKEIQHYNFAQLKRHYKSEMPKSFSAYMRAYNKKDEKFERYAELAKTLNIDIMA